jgi:hypothetical protein
MLDNGTRADENRLRQLAADLGVFLRGGGSCGRGHRGVPSLHTPRRGVRPGRRRVPGPTAGMR